MVVGIVAIRGALCDQAGCCRVHASTRSSIYLCQVADRPTASVLRSDAFVSSTAVRAAGASVLLPRLARAAARRAGEIKCTRCISFVLRVAGQSRRTTALLGAPIVSTSTTSLLTSVLSAPASPVLAVESTRQHARVSNVNVCVCVCVSFD